MPKPAGTVEIKSFVTPEVKAAFIAKCKAEGRTQNWVMVQLITGWIETPQPLAGTKPKRVK